MTKIIAMGDEPTHTRGVSAATVSPKSSSRSLLPREHGAYAQLGLPLAAGLAMGRPGWASFLLAAASLCAFFAHESVLVLVGHRGVKARRVDGTRAVRLLAALGGAAAVMGLLGLLLAPPAARMATALPLALSVVVGFLIAREAQKTTGGEVISAAAMSSASLPVALAAGVGSAVAWGAIGTWIVAFTAATWAVRGVIVSQKEGDLSWSRRVLPLLALMALSVTLWGLGIWPTSNAAATAPIVLLSIGVATLNPHPRHLRRVGWTLATATMLTAALLIVGARW